MTEKSQAKGHCLCRAVTISTKSMNHEISACHCNMCRKWGGGPLLVVECGEDISIDGLDYVNRYQSSDWAERAFCRQCGTHLFYRLKKQNLHFIPAGLIEPQQDLPFNTQVFIEEKPHYYSFANDTKNLTGEELFALFS